MVVTRVAVVADIDLLATFALQRLGSADPTAVLTKTQFEKVHLSLDHQVVHHQLVVQEGVIHHQTTVIDNGERPRDATLMLRLDADPAADAFDAIAQRHPLVHRLHRQHHRLRLLPVPWLFDVAASAVLQQRVRYVDAVRSFCAIARRFGTDTPLGRCFPHPGVIAGLAADELLPLGVDGQRARALQAVAREALRSSLLQPLPTTDANAERIKRCARLSRLPGIGPWTAGMIMGFGFGDPDSIVSGDLHLPYLVVGMLGEAGDQATDARMLELLEPFAGHRFRVVRLLWAGKFGKRPS